MPNRSENFWEQYGTARGARGRNGTRAGSPGADPGTDSASGPTADEGSAPRQSPHLATSGQHECLDWCPICRGAEVLRSGAPPELRSQLASAQRDSLMMLRALIDSYLERTPPPEPGGGRHDDGVEDIPIG